MSQTTSGNDTQVTVDRTTQRRARAAAFIGSTMESYDFLLYGASAGLVFPALFFADLDHGLAVVLSYVSLAAGYAGRPLGGLLFGHFGDRLGRKRMLVITMVVTGGVSVLMGLLPGYAVLGALAPVLLVSLRVVQGIAVGGEWAGAALMSMESSDVRRRGFAGSLSASGGPFGTVVATLVLGLFAALSGDQFTTWGWRVPFLLSAVIVVTGLVLRLRVAESVEFVAARSRRDAAPRRAPLVQVLKDHPRDLVLGTLAVIATLGVQGLLGVFMIPLVVENGAMSRETVLYVLAGTLLLTAVLVPVWALLSDHLGRRPVMLAGGVLGVLLAWPMISLLRSPSATLVVLGFLVGNSLLIPIVFGPLAAFLSEKFPVESRYTGFAVTYQFGALLGSGIMPLVASQLMPDATASPVPLIAFVIGSYVLSSLAVLLSAETRGATSRVSRDAGQEVLDVRVTD
ncbi:MFS transporter [Kineococcus sp. SYSU DK001]|uniref:MFS transporter n=1 Tax=Kineococcus sp. SYSU DK001 TaxID=3383122 RepID=UPI003D7C8FF7